MTLITRNLLIPHSA